jgi:hypothetical protein
VPELHRSAGRATRKQVPLVIPEPGWKYDYPILAHYVTAIDVADLKELAMYAEVEERFDDAKEIFRQIVEFAPEESQRRSAQRGLDRIEGKISRQRVNADSEKAFQQYNINLRPGATYIAPPSSLPAAKIQYNVNLEEGSTFIALPQGEPKPPSTPSESWTQDDIDAIPLESEKGIDYRKLRDFLKTEQWGWADCETLEVMLHAANQEPAGWLDADSLINFPCKDLNTIDRLWVTASSGRFGFSVQKRIWEECGSITSQDLTDWKEFGNRVGWRVKDKWMRCDKLLYHYPLSDGGFPLYCVGELALLKKLAAKYEDGNVEVRRFNEWWWVAFLFSRAKAGEL